MFVRSEQGRYLKQMSVQKGLVANYAWATRKDFRNSVEAARVAFKGWSGRTAFNRGQILYRMAEMLEGRRGAMEKLLKDTAGMSASDAASELDASVDRCMYYAGWADKYAQVVSSVNPVAAPYFNFSVPEPTGVVVLLASRTSPLLGLISGIAPILASGNTCVAVVENEAPVVALELGEVFATSDFPPGVVNVLTGKRDELLPHIASHMDVNAVSCFGGTNDEVALLREEGAANVKRLHIVEDVPAVDWNDVRYQGLYWITPFTEVKTAWHPVGQ
jgi:acyl-CoA reductase-like NAD-dependent aldehyde dehydrogenase